MNREEIEKIVNILNPEHIQETCPALLVGKAVSLFKKMYQGSIQELKNTDDVRDFISAYTGISSSKPVVISDIGYLNKQTTFLLLKLIEEAKFPAIILSTDDKVDSIIMSRIKTFIKFPVDEKTNNNLVPISDAYNHVYGEEKTIIDKTTYYAENCPLLYKLENDIPFNKYRNSMIEILGGTYANK